MTSKPLSVVGIDPGTTVGFAVLDLYKKVIQIGSQKNFSLDDLVHIITEKSKPLIIGCDKIKAPKFVEKFATKVGARIMVPKEDMKIVEKRKITSCFSCKNHHEVDALAGALFAIRKSNGLLSRVNKLISPEDMHLAEEVKKMVVKQKIAVKKAVGMLKQ